MGGQAQSHCAEHRGKYCSGGRVYGAVWHTDDWHGHRVVIGHYLYPGEEGDLYRLFTLILQLHMDSSPPDSLFLLFHSSVLIGLHWRSLDLPHSLLIAYIPSAVTPTIL